MACSGTALLALRASLPDHETSTNYCGFMLFCRLSLTFTVYFTCDGGEDVDCGLPGCDAM
jgi:hypothetical protein